MIQTCLSLESLIRQEAILVEVVFFEFYDRRDLCPTFHRCRPEFREDNKDVYYELSHIVTTEETAAINTDSKKNDRLDDKLRWELLPL